MLGYMAEISHGPASQQIVFNDTQAGIIFVGKESYSSVEVAAELF